MRCCWGIDNALPSDITSRLPRGKTFGFPSDNMQEDIILVAGIDMLRGVWSDLRNKDVAVIVFDTRVRLRHWSIPTLDLTVALGPQLKQTNTIRYVAKNPIKKLLKQTAASFVSNFLTHTYKIRDLEKRAALQKTVFHALWNNTRVDLVSKTNKKSVELIALLNSADAVALEVALQRVKANEKPGVVAKSVGISTFDLNYVLKFLCRT